LKTLSRIGQLLGCGLGDLLETTWGGDRPVYRDRALAKKLAERDEGTPDGVERGWVHAVMLAWQRHAGFRRRASP